MRDLEAFADAELADAGPQGSVHVVRGPVMTAVAMAAAFMAGVEVASATVAAYEAGAGGTSPQPR
jgi:hypothetical protein